MRAVSFDVGISTGVVCAELSAKQIPALKKANTYDSRRLNMDSLGSRLYVEMSKFDPELFIFEWPLDDSRSSLSGATKLAKGWWTAWLLHLKERTGVMPVIVSIRPADWKQGPASKKDIFKLQADNWEKYRPTRHEQDAAQILYWYSMFRLGVYNQNAT